MRKTYFRKAKRSILLSFLISSLLLDCKPAEKRGVYEQLVEDTEAITPQLINLRNTFHKQPELAGKEVRTAARIAAYLQDLGLEVKTGIAGHGVIGILKGAHPGKNIGWRADMDALPTAYKDSLQHNCGHDVHMAIALGMAQVLSEHRENLSGNLAFIFQPEEEIFVGAEQLASSTAFAALELDEIYALHVTALPVGQLLVKPDKVFAYQKRIQLRFNSRLSRAEAQQLYANLRVELQRTQSGATPWIISQAFDRIQGISNPDSDFANYRFLEEQVVIEETADELSLKGYLYETDAAQAANLIPQLKALIKASDVKDDFIDASIIQENPTVHNDFRLVQDAQQILQALGDETEVVTGYGQIPYFNDDFIYFQDKVPGVYFLLGGSNTEAGISAINHAPQFAVDEACIPLGVASFAGLLWERTSID